MSEKLQQDHFKVSAKQKEETEQYLQGRGAQFNTKNRFLINEQTKEHIEGIDDWSEENSTTQYLEQESKTIVNKVESPDVGMSY
ncbi:MAG: radical SAM protein, partial [Bacteroidota bacterium]|nr:radical SAM protein [Bacteroidota bacterium]